MTQQLDKSSEKISGMFNNIAPRYDFLNHLLSLGIDKFWRKKATNIVYDIQPKTILDIATGTGDLAIAMAKKTSAEITGIDFSPEMLAIAKTKVSKKNLSKQIQLLEGNAMKLPFANNSFDLVTIAFGIRNFESLETGLQEIYRVLKPKGKLLILEFSKPEKGAFQHLYRFYFKYLLPFIGKLISKDKSAYTYLFQSADKFPSGNTFIQLLNANNIRQSTKKSLTFGIASIYSGEK